MEKVRLICIKKLEKTDNGKVITALPGSVWTMDKPSMWTREFVLTNENKPECVITVSEYVLELCFKSTARS